jgi:hypothetical protein
LYIKVGEIKKKNLRGMFIYFSKDMLLFTFKVIRNCGAKSAAKIFPMLYKLGKRSRPNLSVFNNIQSK